MIDLTADLSAPERLVLAVDTSERPRAAYLAGVARDAGALIIKEGLEIVTAENIAFCAENAGNAGLEWVADAKLDDIPNTTAAAVKNIISVDHPPSAITIHANSGIDSMKAAQEIAGEAGVLMLAVTELTSKKPFQLKDSLNFILRQLNIEHSELDEKQVRRAFVYDKAIAAHYSGIGGLVASAKELKDPIGLDPRLKSKVSMIPGTRSLGAATHDQQNVTTPEQAIIDGATLLVIGRQVTQSDDPEQEFSAVTEEVQMGLDKRAA